VVGIQGAAPHLLKQEQGHVLSTGVSEQGRFLQPILNLGRLLKNSTLPSILGGAALQRGE
jgi:hypothetical protein